MKLEESDNFKILTSDTENYVFNKINGYTQTWGKTKEDNLDFAKISPHILDIEIVDSCNGPLGNDGKRKVCSFCYKANKPGNKYMSLDMFKTILNKMPKINNSFILQQIAFGLDSNATINPDFKDIVKYTRSQGIIPNATISDANDDMIKFISKNLGAVAISVYDGCEESAFNTIKKLTDKKMKQVNIHRCIMKNNHQETLKLLASRMTDKRLSKMNAIVFLSLKKVGRGENFEPATDEQFNELVSLAMKYHINIGFDSCSAGRFLNCKYVKGLSPAKRKKLSQSVTACESTRESAFIDNYGIAYPCSFNTTKYKGINMLTIKDFITDVWYAKETSEFRTKCLGCFKDCPENLM